MQESKIEILIQDINNPDGIKEVIFNNGLTNIRGYFFPRNSWNNISKTKKGLYFLFGEGERKDIYIGRVTTENRDFYKRFGEHDVDESKDFWINTICFDIPEQIATHLESVLIKKASEINNPNYILKNTQHVINANTIPNGYVGTINETLKYIELLLSILGFNLFDKIETREEAERENSLLICEGMGAKAMGKIDNQGFIVYKGSTMRGEPYTQNFIDRGFEKDVDFLKENKIIEKQGDLYVFKKDHVFSSPFKSATIIRGTSTNGYDYWKDINGKTLGDIREIQN